MTSDQLNAARYEYVRTLSPVQFAEIFQLNIKTGRPFDDIIDERRALVGAVASTQPPVNAAPAIGSEGWFNLFGPDAMDNTVRAAAVRFVKELRPVLVIHTDENGEWVWAVAFESTDFWANSFPSKPEAEAYAAAWNAQCTAAKQV